jgi:hypothetical protein
MHTYIHAYVHTCMCTYMHKHKEKHVGTYYTRLMFMCMSQASLMYMWINTECSINHYAHHFLLLYPLCSCVWVEHAQCTCVLIQNAPLIIMCIMFVCTSQACSMYMCINTECSINHYLYHVHDTKNVSTKHSCVNLHTNHQNFTKIDANTHTNTHKHTCDHKLADTFFLKK